MVVTSEAGNTKLQLTITRYTNPRTHSLDAYRLIRFQSFTAAKCASRHFCYHGTASERILQSQRDRETPVFVLHRAQRQLNSVLKH